MPREKICESSDASRRVLVVDDEDILLEIFEEMFPRWNFQMVAADSVPSALQKIAEETPGFDAALIDLNIPGGGGIRILPTLRERFPSCLIVATSGNHVDPAMTSPRDHGFSASINKPYRMEDLHEILLHDPA